MAKWTKILNGQMINLERADKIDYFKGQRGFDNGEWFVRAWFGTQGVIICCVRTEEAAKNLMTELTEK